MYYLYILECVDQTLYTGITTDLKRRVIEHNENKLGAKYTAARRPVRLVYSEKFKNRSLAAKEEARIKRLRREEKSALIGSSKSTKKVRHRRGSIH
ncbi:MAG: GIY-YIG nuclease family protein [Parcubacteria group bacterium]